MVVASLSCGVFGLPVSRALIMEIYADEIVRRADVLSTVQSSIGAGQDASQTLSRLMDWAEAREVSPTLPSSLLLCLSSSKMLTYDSRPQ